jgi:phenylacetic acid degradation operon negative regulatory protein
MVIERRQLTARGIIASTLLGTRPPQLSARRLVRVGDLFGVSEGTIRVALSRMTAAGDLVRGERGYSLVGQLLERQARQDNSRLPNTIEWDHSWELHAVTSGAKTAPERMHLRRALSSQRLGELREGVWVRPRNLARTDEERTTIRDHVAHGAVTSFCAHVDGDPNALVARLWDLEEWKSDAMQLIESISSLSEQLPSSASSLLGPGFVESAAVLRLLTSDPLLPTEIAPDGWPSRLLRDTYDNFDAAYRQVLRQWLETT